MVQFPHGDGVGSGTMFSARRTKHRHACRHRASPVVMRVGCTGSSSLRGTLHVSFALRMKLTPGLRNVAVVVWMGGGAVAWGARPASLRLALWPMLCAQDIGGHDSPGDTSWLSHFVVSGTPCILFKSIEDPKELLFMWLYLCIYHIRD